MRGGPTGAPGPSYTIEGRSVELPVEVRDALSFSASFLVSAPAVRRLLPHPRLVVPELLPGRTLCSIAAVDYRDNDLGAYHEVAVAFLVRDGPGVPFPGFGLAFDLLRRRSAAYIHRLPVTTSFSCAAGRDIWGFPKTVESITFHDEGERRTCRLECEGMPVLTLSVKRGGTRRFGELGMAALACRDGKLLRTPFVASGEEVGARLDGAVLTLGDHPIASELRRIGLPRRALMTSWIGRMRMRFGAAEEV